VHCLRASGRKSNGISNIGGGEEKKKVSLFCGENGRDRKGTSVEKGKLGRPGKEGKFPMIAHHRKEEKSAGHTTAAISEIWPIIKKRIRNGANVWCVGFCGEKDPFQLYREFAGRGGS